MGDKKQIPSATNVSENSRRHYKYRSNKCLNCGQPLDLSDVYCPYCSQLNSTKSLSLKDFFSEFFNSIVSYDSRLRYTVGDLLFRPGRITRNYTRGQRLRYANPFRFFLSVSIIYFLLNSLVTNLFPETNANYQVNENREPIQFSWSNYDKGTGEDIPAPTKKTEANIENTPGLKELDSAITAEIKKKKLAADTTQNNATTYLSEKQLATKSWSENIEERLFLYKEFYLKSEIKDPAIALDSLRHNNTRYHRWLYSRSVATQKVVDDPKAFVLYMLQKIPFFIFFFTPFYALFFWLVYSRKKFGYMEHIVFIFHLFSFLFIGLFITTLPDLLLDTEIFKSILFGIVGPFYFYKALRNFYEQSRLVTIIKFIFLNIVFWIGASVAAAIFFIITAAVY
ncbi:DUF3667 domain-containing protein [Marinirhabdus gelatinilytica]|uniref:Uncharacterized protein DUF3667 n=1 Tax=Marinirhabdus gelatinilytica TaxID=1703343 RepID=A0A370Q750_9FLAO|nr:DUF3667 domain-containing protein [Marinirhabdus gelatinilytica]RDK84181.1 uncharacterized protein DUF3667 [Marinirhabdus gelatinilytica]